MRVYAEDPEKDFLPATGRLLAYRLPEGNGIRVDNGFVQGMKVTSAFDPMLAKVIVHGKDRNEAINRAIYALENALVLGVNTNIDFLKQLLSHPDFIKARIDTGFIPRHGEYLRPKALTEEQRNLLLAAAAMNHRDFIDPDFSAPEPYATIGNWRN
jgi:propionyl-CoA carboxylase alpha chain/3-methylcrotonyl-CoA carboxylase alpha subunit/acetyl-CoA/propionyl-CoA carboxylase biotin carboxyl carrier protein